MRTPRFTLCLASMLFSPAPAMPGQSPAVPPVVKAEAYGKLPLSFEANRGQTDPQVRFLSRGNGYSLFLTDSAAVLSLRKGAPPLPQAGLLKMGIRPQSGTAMPTKTDVVRMELAGTARGVRVEGADKLPGTANYFIGNDPAKWRSAVPTFAKVRYAGVYPGVDLVYYGDESQLEYDFIVAPRADPKPIRLHFAGARKLKLDPNGDLEVLARNGQIAFHKPVVYQEIAGERQPVEGRFSLLAKNTVSFTLGNYDREQAVVIDPTLAYSTYLSGSSSLLGGSSGYSIAVDAVGDAYIIGTTIALDFPVTNGAYQTVNHTSSYNGSPIPLNVFVVKLNSAGDGLVYSTFLGGTGTYNNTAVLGESPSSIFVDYLGYAYVSGVAHSSDFPTTQGAYQNTNKAVARYQANGFVTKLNPTGTGLVYSTYLGGSGSSSATIGDGCAQITVDNSGSAYVVGTASSSDFPTTGQAYQTVPAGNINGFVTKLNAAGSSLIYSTLLNYADGFAVAVDKTGNAYVGGVATTGFKTTAAAYQLTNHAPSSYNGFVAKVAPTGSSLLYSTFLGGSGAFTLPPARLQVTKCIR